MGKNIWYVHPYAGGPGIGRYMRPYALAKHWNVLGANTTVFTSANHHQLDTPRAAGSLMVDSVTYEFIPCREYTASGWARLLNMKDAAFNLWRLSDQFAKKYGPPDAIISSSPHPYMFLACHRLARYYNAKSIFEVRDLWPLSFIELLGTSKYHPLVLFTGWLENFAYRRSDAVVSLLPLTKPYMIAHGLAPEKWHYIPNGIDAKRPLPDLNADANCGAISKAKLLKAQGYTVIVYTGGMGKPNIVESLVQALSIVKEKHKHKIAAIIVGRGEMRGVIQREIEQAKLQDTVFVFDQISKYEALNLLTFADIGYLGLAPGPLFRFGVSPNKIFDYMNAGLPVVSYMNAGNDLVGDANCGISIQSNNVSEVASAIITLANLGDAKRKILGQNGKHYVELHHSYEQLATRYLNLLN